MKRLTELGSMVQGLRIWALGSNPGSTFDKFCVFEGVQYLCFYEDK